MLGHESSTSQCSGSRPDQHRHSSSTDLQLDAGCVIQSQGMVLLHHAPSNEQHGSTSTKIESCRAARHTDSFACAAYSKKGILAESCGTTAVVGIVPAPAASALMCWLASPFAQSG